MLSLLIILRYCHMHKPNFNNYHMGRGIPERFCKKNISHNIMLKPVTVCHLTYLASKLHVPYDILA